MRFSQHVCVFFPGQIKAARLVHHVAHEQTCALTCEIISLSVCVEVLGVGGNKGLGGRCGGSVKLRFLIRGGIPEPEQSHHQTVLSLWQANGGMRFSRRYGGTFGLSGGGKVHRARR